MSTTLPPDDGSRELDLDAVRASIDKAEELVGELAAGDQTWKMTIPVDMDRDSDMILISALTSAKLLVVQVERLTRDLATMTEVAKSNKRHVEGMAQAYELKVADLAKETERVSILAEVLVADNHGPDGFHADRDRCRHCAALKKALRPAATDGAS